MLIHGLFMDVFRWDDENAKSAESNMGEMNSSLPMLHMKPKRNFISKLSPRRCIRVATVA